MKVSWDLNKTLSVGSVEEFLTLLDQLGHEAGGKGMIVEAIHDNGRTLALGVGLSESVLTFFDGRGASYTSVGDREREDYLTFKFGGDVSEMMGAKAVSDAVARMAARRFFETGECPEGVEWEREWA